MKARSDACSPLRASARLACTPIHIVMGGFREEKTGERGVPPSVARAREDVIMAYLAAQPSMSMEWVARHFDLLEGQVREYIESLRDRAAKKREADDA